MKRSLLTDEWAKIEKKPKIYYPGEFYTWEIVYYGIDSEDTNVKYTQNGRMAFESKEGAIIDAYKHEIKKDEYGVRSLQIMERNIIGEITDTFHITGDVKELNSSFNIEDYETYTWEITYWNTDEDNHVVLHNQKCTNKFTTQDAAEEDAYKNQLLNPEYHEYRELKIEEWDNTGKKCAVYRSSIDASEQYRKI
jgi:hypothetical protein